jgi:hypothetical protein
MVKIVNGVSQFNSVFGGLSIDPNRGTKVVNEKRYRLSTKSITGISNQPDSCRTIFNYTIVAHHELLLVSRRRVTYHTIQSDWGPSVMKEVTLQDLKYDNIIIFRRLVFENTVSCWVWNDKTGHT